MGTEIKIPTLKDELVEIKNNPEQYKLYEIIKYLKYMASIGYKGTHIKECDSNIKSYLESQGLEVTEAIPGPGALITWG